jgi:anti-sigma B factor antagonist
MMDHPLDHQHADVARPAGDAREGGVAVEHPEPGVAVLELTGEHDVYTASHVGEALEALADAGGVVVDVSGTTFMDSTVLRVLFDGLRGARERGHGFAVVTGSPPAPEVARVFDISGVTRLLPTYGNREAAARAARAGAGAA